MSPKEELVVDTVTPSSSCSGGPTTPRYEQSKPQLSIVDPNEASIAPMMLEMVKEPNPVEFRSGYRGVSWNRRMKAWLAFWSEGKNRRSKTFNAKVMGFEKARAAAIDFLKKKKQLLQQLDPNFADFDDADEFDDDYNGSLADSTSTTTSSNTPASTPVSATVVPAVVPCRMCGALDPSAAGGAVGGAADFLQNNTAAGEDQVGATRNCLYCSY